MAKERKSTAPSVKTKVATEAGGEQVVTDSAALKKLLEDLRKFHLRLADNLNRLTNIELLVGASGIMLDEWTGCMPDGHTALCELCPALSDAGQAWKLLVRATDDINYAIVVYKNHIGAVEDMVLSAPGGHIGSKT